MIKERLRTKDFNYKLLGNRIKNLRDKNGLAQAELGRMLTKNICESYICYMENGKRRIKAKELSELAYIFNIKIDTLIKDCLSNEWKEFMKQKKKEIVERLED